MVTDAAGSFAFETILPGRYLNGATFRPRHLHVIISPPDGAPLITQIYFAGDPYIEDDRWASDPDAATRIIPLIEDGEALRGLVDINLDVDATTATPGDDHGLPTATTLLQNFPNPFNPLTTIRYQLRVPGAVSLDVFTADGRLIRTLVQGHRPLGYHAARWDGRDRSGREAPSGVYLAQLRAGGGAKPSRCISFADCRRYFIELHCMKCILNFWSIRHLSSLSRPKTESGHDRRLRRTCPGMPVEKDIDASCLWI